MNSAHQVILAIGLTVPSAVMAVAAQDPTTHPEPAPLSAIRPDHPRLWFNSDNLPLLRQRWNDPGYSMIVNRYRGKTDELSLALEGLATENGALCSAAAVTAISNYSRTLDPETGFSNPLVLVFDWCYQLLNESDRAALRSKITDLRHYYRYDPQIGLTHRFLWHEAFFTGVFGYISSVLAIEGEPGVASELRAAQNVLQNLQELGDEVSGDGGYRTYLYQGSFQILPFFLWSYATDGDFTARSEFSRNFARWAAYKLSPTGRGLIRGPADDDCSASGYTSEELAAGGFFLLASHFHDPLAQWLGQHFSNAFRQTDHWPDHDGPSFISLAFYDENQVPQSPGTAGLPLSAYFEKIGMVHVRSSWNARPDVVHSWFYNGPSADHAGESQNHLTIWRGDDPLIIQGGNYLGTPSLYQSHYYERAIARNTLIFSPDGSVYPDREGGQTSRWSNFDLSRQRYPVADRVGSWPGQHMYSGEIVHFSNTGNDTIVSGDATLAYNPDSVRKYVRDFVYLSPGIFLIRDRFRTENVSSIRSIFHSRRKPIIHPSGNVTLGSSSAGIIVSNDDEIVIKNGNSQAIIRVLWPESPMIRLVGGYGFEGYVDSYNTNPTTDCQEWLLGSFQLAERVRWIEGQWRSEVSTTQLESMGQMIQAIFVSQIDPVETPKYELQHDGTVTYVTVTESGRTRVIVLPEDGVPSVTSLSRRTSPGRRLTPTSHSSGALIH